MSIPRKEEVHQRLHAIGIFHLSGRTEEKPDLSFILNCLKAIKFRVWAGPTFMCLLLSLLNQPHAHPIDPFFGPAYNI